MPAITDTTTYPVFADKAQLLRELVEISNGGSGRKLPNERLTELVWRLSNTDTSTFADPAARHDD